MATVPSPSKQLKAEPVVVPRDPEDLRGSYQRVASQHDLTAQLLQAARKGREAVAKGLLSERPFPAQTGRPLGPAASEPNLSFSNAPRGLADSHYETMQTIFGSGGSRREVQPMYETGSPTSSAGPALLSGADGYYRRAPTIEAAMGEDDMDGFDPEDVFGSPAKMLSFDNPESQTVATGTGAGLKRAFEEADEDENGDDIQMDLTDVEDEGEGEEEGMAPLREGESRAKMFANMPSTRRGLAKTQSLPAAAFQGSVGF